MSFPKELLDSSKIHSLVAVDRQNVRLTVKRNVVFGSK